jgi:hypothetical protein
MMMMARNMVVIVMLIGLLIDVVVMHMMMMIIMIMIMIMIVMMIFFGNDDLMTSFPIFPLSSFSFILYQVARQVPQMEFILQVRHHSDRPCFCQRTSLCME